VIEDGMKLREEHSVRAKLVAELFNVIFSVCALLQPPSRVVADHVLNLMYVPNHDKEMKQAGVNEEVDVGNRPTMPPEVDANAGLASSHGASPCLYAQRIGRKLRRRHFRTDGLLQKTNQSHYVGACYKNHGKSYSTHLEVLAREILCTPDGGANVLHSRQHRSNRFLHGHRPHVPHVFSEDKVLPVSPCSNS
jgi:hypothetical protein